MNEKLVAGTSEQRGMCEELEKISLEERRWIGMAG